MCLFGPRENLVRQGRECVDVLPSVVIDFIQEIPVLGIFVVTNAADTGPTFTPSTVIALESLPIHGLNHVLKQKIEETASSSEIGNFSRPVTEIKMRQF